MNKNEIVRRSVSFPKELDARIELIKNKYSYNVKNELIINLIEYGIIKLTEDIELKNRIDKLLNNTELIYDKLGIK